MEPVTIEIQGDIAVVTIDNPPVNAASLAVRRGLMNALHVTEDAKVQAVVLRCAGRTFVAGADAKEFNAPPVAPFLPDVCAAIEAASVPWVAAVHGTALGGGCEIALACMGRIADTQARLGFPEVSLGLIPGAGGTVRLPRIIPTLHALDMVVTGKPVDAAKALDWGLIDAIAAGDLVETAKLHARELADRPSLTPLSSRDPVDPPTQSDWDAAVKRLTSRARGQNAPYEAAAAIHDAIHMTAQEAFAAERARFVRLKEAPQSQALRHVFFAERSVARMDRLRDVVPRAVSIVGVVGGGTMGAGIAAALVLSGLKVILIERDEDALAAGLTRVTDTLADSLKRGLLTKDAHARMVQFLDGATDYAALSGADLVIEAVFEDMSVKKDVFARLDAATRPDAVLATNTSYLDVSEIADSVADPSRVLGLHFFSPAHIMKLVEVVHPERVADDVLATGIALSKRLGKIAVPAGVCDGFIGNRIMSAYRREADYMIEDGALPHEVDAAMREFGFPMGVFQMQDLAGLDIAWAMRKRRAMTRPTQERYVAIADKLCEAGRFGRKTGQGWYDYRTDPKGTVDPEVTRLVKAESSSRGITRTALSKEEILQRTLGAMQSEGQAVLDEGIAATPEAIDVVMILGYGFPRWRGGPMYMRAHPDSGI